MPLRICRVFAVLALALNAPEALAACLPDPPMDNDTVVCDGTDSTGYDGSGATGLTVTTGVDAILDESDPGLDSAILLSDDNTVTIGTTAQINVTEAGGFGVRANDDNFIDNQGTIMINGADGRGISIGDNTTGILPNGAVNSSDIFAIGIRSIALETGMNSGVATTGLIEVMGNESRGISAADHSDSSIGADITNANIINVSGDDAIGIKAGDGWVTGAIVGEPGASAPQIRNVAGASINVSGTRAYGIFAGDDTNLNFNHNSFVLNLGTIDVTGVDAIGVSLGGNDLRDPFDLLGSVALDVTSLENGGEILGGIDAGPLVEFRAFVAGKENTIRNLFNGRIIADLNNQRIAIRGSDGDELVINLGEIQGDIEFNDGDDRYVHAPGAIQTGSILGGNGNDQVILISSSNPLVAFDVSALVDIENLVVGGGPTGWSLRDAAGFTGLTAIRDMGRLQVPTPLELGGAFSVDPTGILQVTLDGTTPPLTIEGMSTLDGTLIVNQGPALSTSTTPYRVVATLGGLTGVFADIQFPDALATQTLTPIYDSMGLLVLFQDTGLLGAARGTNQLAIAQNLTDIDAAGGASPDLQNLIDELFTSTGNLSAVYSALNPEVYDIHTTIAVEGGRRVANLLLDRPRECQDGASDRWQRVDAPLPCHARSWSPWLAAVGGFRSREKFTEHPRYDSQLGGLVFGVDVRPIEGLDLTFAVSSQRGTLNAAGAGESTVTLTDLSGQAAWTAGLLRVQGIVSWGHGFHRDRRLIRASETTTPLDSRGNEDHDSDRISIAGEVGVVFAVGPLEVEPVAQLDWAWVYQSSIHESGAGGFGIRIDDRDDSIGSISTGLRLSTTYQHSRFLASRLEWMDGIWRPVIDVRWRQMVAGHERDIDARFDGSPGTVGDFTISGQEDEGGFEVGAGLSFTPSNANRLQFDLRYDAFLASHTVEHNLVGRMLIGF